MRFMKRGSLRFLLLFGLLWTALVGAFDGFVVYNIYRQVRSTHFAQTDGVITSSHLTHHRSSKGGTTYGVAIRYMYRVNAVAYNSDRFRYNAGSSSDSQWAHDAVSEHPAGATVRVYYDPQNPADAVLSPGVNGSDLFLLLFLTPFNMIMLGLWSMPAAALRRKLCKPGAGGAKWSDDGRRIRVRLPRISPLMIGLIAAGAASFVSIFVVLFSTGFHPGVPVALGAWILVILLGLGPAWWNWRKLSKGACDLVINRAENSVDLPSTFDRKQRLTVPGSAISGITVEPVSHRGRRGTTYSYAVNLQCWSRTEKLADWYDQERAEELAAWLRTKLKPGEPDAPPRKVRADSIP